VNSKRVGHATDNIYYHFVGYPRYGGTRFGKKDITSFEVLSHKKAEMLQSEVIKLTIQSDHFFLSLYAYHCAMSNDVPPEGIHLA
jgi:REP element-mobilizing transposase RayT